MDESEFEVFGCGFRFGSVRVPAGSAVGGVVLIVFCAESRPAPS